MPRPVRTTDLTNRTVPLLHGAGITALLAGPVFSATSADGAELTARLEDYGEWFALFGGEWMLYVSFAGVILAVAAAILVRPSANRVRLPLIALGSLTGLTFPVMFYVHYGNAVSATAYFQMWGWGLSIYAWNCLIAAIIPAIFWVVGRRKHPLL